MDKKKGDQTGKQSRADGRGFPNYLLQRTDGRQQEERKVPAAFQRKDTRATGNHVPFLESRPNAYRQHQDAVAGEKTRSAQSEERMIKREERIRSSLPLYARHKSRRPFRPTELPSLWRKQEEAPQRDYDMPALKAAMRLLDRDLILLDLNPVPEGEVASDKGKKAALPGTIGTLKSRPNRALHRSLSGIMEQERVHESRKRERLHLKRNNPDGFSSYFE